MSVLEFMIDAVFAAFCVAIARFWPSITGICARAGMAPNAIAPKMIVAANMSRRIIVATLLLVAAVGRRVRAGGNGIGCLEFQHFLLRGQSGGSLHRGDRPGR